MREFNQIVPFYTWSSIILLPLTTMRCDSTSLSCYPSSHRHSVVSNPSIYSSCFASFKAIISCGIQFDHPSCSPWVTEMKNSASYPDVLVGQGSLSYAMLKAQYLLSGYHKIVAVHPQIRTLITCWKDLVCGALHSSSMLFSECIVNVIARGMSKSKFEIRSKFFFFFLFFKTGAKNIYTPMWLRTLLSMREAYGLWYLYFDQLQIAMERNYAHTKLKD